MTYEITIGLPIYNKEKYIALTLETALAQTYQSIEFLVLDDRGTDGSMDIVREYQQTHPRGKDIRIVSQPHNMGIGEARNRILEEARGKYLFFLDADDRITSDTIEILVNAAKEYDAQVVMASYDKIDYVDDTIKINVDDYKIEANDKFVELSKGLTYVNHKVSKNYDEVYKTIKKYINNPNDTINDSRKQRLVAFVVALVLTIIIGLVLEITKG